MFSYPLLIETNNTAFNNMVLGYPIKIVIATSVFSVDTDCIYTNLLVSVFLARSVANKK